MNNCFSELLLSSSRMGIAFAVVGTMKDAKNYKDVDDLKQEILKKDAKRYDSLINDGVICFDDLDEFSDELKENVRSTLELFKNRRF